VARCAWASIALKKKDEYMPATPVRLVCADYMRIMPLVTGAVKMQDLDLSLEVGQQGSWPFRAETLLRSLKDPGVQGGEASMGIHLGRIDRNDRSIIALPVFVLRNFTVRDLYIRKGAPFATPGDLAGKRIGMYSWTASGSIWYRHFLVHSGVDLDAVQWWIGDIDQPYSAQHAVHAGLPAGVRTPPPGRTLSQMLLEGELDAIYSPPRPRDFHPTEGPIVRLYPDTRAAETAYFRETGVFPPQHLVVLQRAAWEADKSLARRVTEAFIRCEDYFSAALHSFPYASPWLNQELEAMQAMAGGNPYQHGLERNRATMEQFCEQGFRAGLTRRRVGVDEYFAEFLES
jgi:4,5-dihydroxyphthalate decarboxylase